MQIYNHNINAPKITQDKLCVSTLGRITLEQQCMNYELIKTTYPSGLESTSTGFPIPSNPNRNSINGTRVSHLPQDSNRIIKKHGSHDNISSITAANKQH